MGGLNLMIGAAGAILVAVVLLSVFLSHTFGALPIVDQIVVNAALGLGIGIFLVGIGFLSINYITIIIMFIAAIIAVVVSGALGIL